ncbi:MAG: hypothetical protein H7Z42_10360, partial [Roseiflexaceae bacterium]|nr:hypothetical protein [Roseiflexaceae bacterium]
MPVSLREDIQIDCLACGQPFVADVWSIVDAAERPDLADALLDGTLDAAACPHCAAANQSQVALLYHDPAAKRLNFAAPAYVEEYRWRDRAQQLIAALGSQLPDEAQLPYLNDIDLNQGIESLRRAVQRRQRGRGTGKQPSFGKPIPLPGSGASLALSPQPSALSPQPSVLNDEIELVMAVSSLDELRAVVLRHPQLLSDQADLLLRGLADTAFNDGDRDLSTALHTARTALADLRAGREVVLAPHTPTDAAGEAPVRPALAEQSYQSLLHTASDAALKEVVRLFPALLE